MGGYQKGILEIDLKNKTHQVTKLEPELLKMFIGGRGLGARLLWDRLPEGADPLDDRAPLMFLIGPLTGLVPGGAQLSTVFKSPLTGNTLSHSVVGAHFGAELKAAGYDGLIITGRATRPTHVRIVDDRIDFLDASHLWGKNTFETEQRLKKESEDRRTRCLSIGIAGENGVLFAGIQQEYFRSAARNGSGTLMGAKNLKAITVRGTHPIEVERPDAFFKMYAEIWRRLKEARTGIRGGYYLVRWGSTVGSVRHSDANELDVKNYKEAYWDEIDSIGGLEFERRCKVKSRGCFLCPVPCMQHGVIRMGKYAGRIACPDYDSTSTIGGGCLVNDHDGLIYLNSLGDELGVDNISMGNVTGFAMECYEKGLITKRDLDGIELEWGDVEAIKALWDLIIRRDGIGEVLSKGVRHAAETFGGGSSDFAMHAKGLEFGAYTPQAKHDRGLQYAVGDRGGCHHFGTSIGEQNFRVMADSLVVCTWHRHFVTPELYISALNAAAGWDVEPKEWDFLAERLLIMSRSYNIREGMRPLIEDVLPMRTHNDALTWGPQAGAYYPIEKFYKDRREWYKTRGCSERGIPTKEHLAELGLDFVHHRLEDQ
jgi:aldehyde:ferredoxin oxidoreductase